MVRFMLHVTLLTVGKIKESYLRQGFAEYQKRLRPYIKLEIKEVADEPLGKEPERAKEIEGERLLSAAKANSYLVVFDPGGKQISSEEFAGWFGDREREGREVTMLIGGASGLSEKVLVRADEKISISRMTFPHQLFRLILMEQVYRAFKILRREPYHY